MNLLSSNLLDKNTASDLADSFDSNNNKSLSAKEMSKKYDKLVRNNNDLTYEIKNLIRDIYVNKINKKENGYNISKKEFIKLLTTQDAEHKHVLTKHESAKRTIKKETRNNVESNNLNIKDILNKGYSKNSSKKDVILLQRTLKNLGAHIVVDGSWGRNTKRELLEARKISKTIGEKEVSTKKDIVSKHEALLKGDNDDFDINKRSVKRTSNKVSENSVNNNEVSESLNITKTLRKGAKGEQVKVLQRALGITADGDFGNATLRAVKRWQKENGLTADGVVGRRTLTKLKGSVSVKGNVGDKSGVEGLKNSLQLSQKLVDAINKVYFDDGSILDRDDGVLGLIFQLFKGGKSKQVVEEMVGNKIKNDKKAKQVAKMMGVSDTMVLLPSLIKVGAAAALGGVHVTTIKLPFLQKFQIKKGVTIDSVTQQESGEKFSSRISKILRSSKKISEIKDVNELVANSKLVKDFLTYANQETFDIDLPILEWITSGGDKNIKRSINSLGKGKSSNENSKILRDISSKIMTELSSQYGYNQSLTLENMKGILQKKYSSHTEALKSFDMENNYMSSSNVSKYKEETALLTGVLHISNLFQRLADKEDRLGGNKTETMNKIEANKLQIEIDNELGINEGNLKKVNVKRSRYAPKLDLNNIESSINKYSKETVDGKTSVLSGIIRGIKEHYKSLGNINYKALISAMKSGVIVNSIDGLQNSSLSSGDIIRFKNAKGPFLRVEFPSEGHYIYIRAICGNVNTAGEFDFSIAFKDIPGIPIIIGLKRDTKKSRKRENEPNQQGENSSSNPGAEGANSNADGSMGDVVNPGETPTTDTPDIGDTPSGLNIPGDQSSTPGAGGGAGDTANGGGVDIIGDGIGLTEGAIGDAPSIVIDEIITVGGLSIDIKRSILLSILLSGNFDGGKYNIPKETIKEIKREIPEIIKRAKGKNLISPTTNTIKIPEYE